MNKQAALISLLLSIIVSQPVFAEKQLDNSRAVRVKAIVEQMRGISMQLTSAKMGAAPQKMRLDPNIKAGQNGKISEIRDAGDWANPFITVSDDAITISWGKSMHHKRLHQSVLKSPEEIESFLVGLPVSAWPYGRIIALSEHPIGGLPGGRAYRKRSWDLIMAAMKRLDVQVNPWPCA